MAIDLGTGDGRLALRRARREPATLVVGIDPVAEAMAEASARAARRAARGGLSNVVFVVASVEALPVEACGLADEVAIVLPWGSLLEGILTADALVVRAIADLLRPGGRLLIALSLVERDGQPSVNAARLDRAFAAVGMRAAGHRPAMHDELRALGSTWAKRLRAGSPERPALLLRYERGSGLGSR